MVAISTPGGNPLAQALLASQAPDYITDQMKAQRAYALGQALQSQALEPINGNGGSISWTQGLAKIANALIGASSNRRGDRLTLASEQALGSAVPGMFGLGGPQMPQGAPTGVQGSPMPQSAPNAPVVHPSGPVTPGDEPLPSSSPVAPPQAAPQPPSAPPQQAGGAPQPLIPPLPGMTPQQSMMAYFTDSSGYWDKLATANTPTDFQKMVVAAGIDPKSPLGQQLIQGQLAKLNNVPPISVRQNGVALDPFSHEVLFRNPNVGQNQGVEFNAQGQPTRIYNIPGALESAQAQAQAQASGTASGKAPYDVIQVWDPNKNAFVTVPKSSVTGGAGPIGGGSLNTYYKGQTGGLQSSPSLGAQSAANTYGSGSANAFLDTQDIAENSPQRVQALREMQDLLKGGLPTGPTTAKFQQLAEEHGLPFGYSNNAFVFNKDAARFVAQSAQDLGLNGSDARLGMMANASPNMKMTPQALGVVIPTMIGLEYAKMAKATAAATWAQHSPQTNAQFESTWRQNYDPRMFTAYAQGGPAALAKAAPNLRAQWLRDYRALKGMGVDFTQFAQ